MALEIRRRYYDNGMTMVLVKDSDQTYDVSFEAQLEGNHLFKNNAELLTLARDWFNNKYNQEFIVSKNTNRLQNVEEELIAKTEQLTKLIKENEIATTTIGEMSLLFLNEGLLILDDDGNMILNPAIKKILT